MAADAQGRADAFKTRLQAAEQQIAALEAGTKELEAKLTECVAGGEGTGRTRENSRVAAAQSLLGICSSFSGSSSPRLTSSVSPATSREKQRVKSLKAQAASSAAGASKAEEALRAELHAARTELEAAKADLETVRTAGTGKEAATQVAEARAAAAEARTKEIETRAREAEAEARRGAEEERQRAEKAEKARAEWERKAAEAQAEVGRGDHESAGWRSLCQFAAHNPGLSCLSTARLSSSKLIRCVLLSLLLLLPYLPSPGGRPGEQARGLACRARDDAVVCRILLLARGTFACPACPFCLPFPSLLSRSLCLSPLRRCSYDPRALTGSLASP